MYIEHKIYIKFILRSLYQENTFQIHTYIHIYIFIYIHKYIHV